MQVTLGTQWDDRLDLSWEVVHAADRRDALAADLSDSTVHDLRATWRSQGRGLVYLAISSFERVRAFDDIRSQDQLIARITVHSAG